MDSHVFEVFVSSLFLKLLVFVSLKNFNINLSRVFTLANQFLLVIALSLLLLTCKVGESTQFCFCNLIVTNLYFSDVQYCTFHLCETVLYSVYLRLV